MVVLSTPYRSCSRQRSREPLGNIQATENAISAVTNQVKIPSHQASAPLPLFADSASSPSTIINPLIFVNEYSLLFFPTYFSLKPRWIFCFSSGAPQREVSGERNGETEPIVAAAVSQPRFESLLLHQRLGSTRSASSTHVSYSYACYTWARSNPLLR